MKAVLTFLLMGLPFFLFAQPSDTVWKEYVSPDNSFKISYPESWKMGTAVKDSKVVFFADGNEESPEAMIALFIGALPEDEAKLSIQEVMAKSSSQIKAMPRHKVIGYEVKNLGEHPGFTFEYSMWYSKKPQDQRHFYGWAVLNQGHFYTIRYFGNTSADSKYLEMGKKIINSLTFPGGTYVDQPQQITQADTHDNGDGGSAASKNTISGDATSATLIQADVLYPFQEGLAIIQKGTSYGVINSKGEIVIPYNKYNFANFKSAFDGPPLGFQNGTCAVQDPATRLMGVIDKQGKLIVPCEYQAALPFDKAGWASVADEGTKYFFINASGTKIPMPVNFSSLASSAVSGFQSHSSMRNMYKKKVDHNNGVSSYYFIVTFEHNMSPGIGENDLFGYFERNGKQVIAPQYLTAEPFSEGLACVSKKDEFGKIKYGFINPKGETIIPFMFSQQPGNFSNGLAYVEPADKTEFSFCFVNKKGELVLKQENSNIIPLWEKEGLPEFESGYFRTTIKSGSTHLRVIDTTGKDVAVINKEHDITSGFRGNAQDVHFFKLRDGVQFFIYNNLSSRTDKTAYINLKTNKLIYTPFSYISEFDPASGLSLFTHKGEYGYMDLDGNVVMKTAPAEKW